MGYGWKNIFQSNISIGGGQMGIESLAKPASALSAATESFSSLLAPEPALLLSRIHIRISILIKLVTFRLWLHGAEHCYLLGRHDTVHFTPLPFQLWESTVRSPLTVHVTCDNDCGARLTSPIPLSM